MTYAPGILPTWITRPIGSHTELHNQEERIKRKWIEMKMSVTGILKFTYTLSCLEFAIWQGMGKSPSIWQGMEKDQSYTWYIRIYTKYRAGYTKYIAIYTYTRDIPVYTKHTQVYQRLNRYILMTCQYIPVYIMVIRIFHFRISWSASWCSPEGGGTATR